MGRIDFAHTGQTVLQLDGSYILRTDCTCPPMFTTAYGQHSILCPIDVHRIAWLQENWMFDDEGKIVTTVDNTLHGQLPYQVSFDLQRTPDGTIVIVTRED